MFAAYREYVFGTSRVVELAGSEQGTDQEGGRSSFACKVPVYACFPVNLDPPPLSTKSHGLGDIWSPNISVNSIPWSTFLAFSSWAKFLGPGQGRLPG